MTEEISLRPQSLRPGGGFGIKAHAKSGGPKVAAQSSVESAATVERSVAKRVYSKDFLMMMMDLHSKCPMELTLQHQLNSEIMIASEAERDQQRQAIQKVVEEADDRTDTRDWRTREDAGEAGAQDQPAAVSNYAAPPSQSSTPATGEVSCHSSFFFSCKA